MRVNRDKTKKKNCFVIRDHSILVGVTLNTRVRVISM